VNNNELKAITAGRNTKDADVVCMISRNCFELDSHSCIAGGGSDKFPSDSDMYLL
jgi:hypothetical protein